MVLYLATIYEQQHEHQKPTQIGLRRQFIISVYVYSTIWDGPVVQIKGSLSIFFPYRQILQVEGGWGGGVIERQRKRESFRRSSSKQNLLNIEQQKEIVPSSLGIRLIYLQLLTKIETHFMKRPN